CSSGTAGASSRLMSRWQWLSTTAIGSRSGAGGRSARRESVTGAPAGGASYRGLRVVDQPEARPLLLDDRGIELGEDRRRLGNRGPDLHRAVLPARGGGILAGDDWVGRAGRVVEVLDLADLRH